MDQPVVTSVALRFALTRLAEATGATALPAVRVAMMDLGVERMYAALVPIECRAEVHHYIAERTDVSMPLDGGALTLNHDQAAEVIGLAYDVSQAPRPGLGTPAVVYPER
jgi:hypothetical protein